MEIFDRPYDRFFLLRTDRECMYIELFANLVLFRYQPLRDNEIYSNTLFLLTLLNFNFLKDSRIATMTVNDFYEFFFLFLD